MAGGYAYGPPGEAKAREAERQGSPASRESRERPGLCCCSGLSLEDQMAKYVLVLGCLSAAFLGPYSGVLMAAAISGPDHKLYYNAVTTVVLFLLSLGLVVRPGLRAMSRVWLAAGLGWVLAGWLTYFRKEFNEMPERWLVVTVVQSCVYGLLGFLPLFTTDPLSVAIFT